MRQSISGDSFLRLPSFLAPPLRLWTCWAVCPPPHPHPGCTLQPGFHLLHTHKATRAWQHLFQTWPPSLLFSLLLSGLPALLRSIYSYLDRLLFYSFPTFPAQSSSISHSPLPPPIPGFNLNHIYVVEQQSSTRVDEWVPKHALHLPLFCSAVSQPILLTSSRSAGSQAGSRSLSTTKWLIKNHRKCYKINTLKIIPFKKKKRQQKGWAAVLYLTASVSHGIRWSLFTFSLMFRDIAALSQETFLIRGWSSKRDGKQANENFSPRRVLPGWSLSAVLQFTLGGILPGFRLLISHSLRQVTAQPVVDVKYLREEQWEQKHVTADVVQPQALLRPSAPAEPRWCFLLLWRDRDCNNHLTWDMPQSFAK